MGLVKLIKKFKYPYKDSDFSGLSDYINQLCELANQQPSNFLKISTVIVHVCSVLQPFIDEYQVLYDLTSDNSDFFTFLKHIHMELRRRRSHLKYHNPRHRIRLQSIVSFCPCLYCRQLFRHVSCPWSDLPASMASSASSSKENSTWQL